MWLILGRPKAQPAAGAPRTGFGQRRSTPAPSVSSPDDDEEYLRWLKAKAERERRSREAESQNKQDPEDNTPGQSSGQN